MRTALLALAGIGACTEYTIEKGNDVTTEVEDGGAPDILVTPSSIDFGRVAVGETDGVVQTVTVENRGDAALHIEDLRLEDPNAPFDVAAIGSVLLEPQTRTDFTVTYYPLTAVESATRVLVESDDPDTPQATVDLLGAGVAPVILLDPVAYDFGTMYIGCAGQTEVTVSNVGNADLVVDSFSYVTASDDLFFDEDEATNGALPWTIAPGGSRTVLVDYEPLDDYADEGYLSASSNDPLQPVSQAYQVGAAQVAGHGLDVFEQPIRSAADILFVVDNSCSMYEEQTNLANNFSSFMTTISAMDADYQIAVITTDSPNFRGDILTPDSSDPTSEFQRQTLVGTSGSGYEMGLEMAYQATQSGGDAGPGSDFLRDDAQLNIVIVSDEPDSSSRGWSNYVSHFWGLKTDPDMAIVHAIAGDYPSGCATAAAGVGYYEASVAMGGLYLSICATDWASHLEALAENSATDLSTFELTAWPVPETVEVRVDGVVQTTGWTYVEADRAVSFDDDHIPEGGATIEIEYALYGDCEQ